MLTTLPGGKQARRNNRVRIIIVRRLGVEATITSRMLQANHKRIT